MTTTDLKFDECGTLPKPGPLGRIYRLGMGIVLFYFFVIPVWGSREALLSGNFGPNLSLWIGLGVGLFLINYVVNIGFSLAWKKWPMIVSAGFLGALALYDYSFAGDWAGPAFGTGFLIWGLYFSLHLGVCFLVAAVIGTPGCEMRAFHDLFSRITGIATKEHFCPVGIMQPLDNWEAKQFWWKKYA